MASCSCVPGCGHFLASYDGHDRCPSCLGYQHAEAALVNESCSHCGNMTTAMLRFRYLLAKRGCIPLAMPHSSSCGSRRATSAHGQGDMRITVRASPSSASLWASHSSSASHHLVFPDELAGSSDRAGPSISFRAPEDDRMSIAASEDKLGSGDDNSAALPPSGRVALPESDPELTAMLSRAAQSVRLHWRPPPSPERSRLDDWFLGAQVDRRQPPPVSFFPEVHKEVTRSWRLPFLPETGLVPPPSSPPSTVGWPKGMWRSPQSSVLLPCSSACNAPPPGGVIHVLGLQVLVSTHPAPAVRCCLHPTAGCSSSVCSLLRAPSCCLHLRSCSATDSVCLASSQQVQGRSVHLGVEQSCPCLACRSHGPVDEGGERAGPYFIVPKKGGGLQPILDLHVLNRALH